MVQILGDRCTSDSTIKRGRTKRHSRRPISVTTAENCHSDPDMILHDRLIGLAQIRKTLHIPCVSPCSSRFRKRNSEILKREYSCDNVEGKVPLF